MFLNIFSSSYILVKLCKVQNIPFKTFVFCKFRIHVASFILLSLVGLLLRNQMTRWPDDRQSTQQVRGVAPLSSLPYSLFCNLYIKELYLRHKYNYSSLIQTAALFTAAAPLWLAVLADGHLFRGPHWFLGGRPKHSSVCQDLWLDEQCCRGGGREGHDNRQWRNHFFSCSVTGLFLVSAAAAFNLIW